MPRNLQSANAHSLCLELRQVAEQLLAGASENRCPVKGFEYARQILEALPLTSADFCAAVNRLGNAQRYLQSGERGAARFELRQLLQGFAS
jgi:hypothetical protein